MWNYILFGCFYAVSMYLLAITVADKVEEKLKDRFDEIDEQLDLLINPVDPRKDFNDLVRGKY